jgi:hypothetical protein
MNKQRLSFAAFLVICVYGLWYLQKQLTPERPDVIPYAARPELMDDAPALVTGIETSAEESQLAIDVAALRQTAQQRMEAASIQEIMEAGPDFSCNMAPIREVTESSSNQIYQWRHEAAHVILNGMLAAGPLWLHEGLAEYFELLGMRQQYSQVSPNLEWLNLARSSIANGYPASLADFLDVPPEGWRGEAQAVHYALGWSLVYFMLDNENGKGALTALLQKLADDYCTPTNSTVQLNLSYPGGIPALQEDFYAWLNNEADKRVHTY